MKQCVDCEKVLPLNKFPLYPPGKKRITLHKPRCEICDVIKRRAYERGRPKEVKKRLAKYTRNKRIANKEYFIIKFGNRCHDCNRQYPICVYDFHHLNPKEKDSDPGLLFGLGHERIEKELLKCILLCANCHRIRHYNESAD